jgi:hypothetical protein
MLWICSECDKWDSPTRRVYSYTHRCGYEAYLVEMSFSGKVRVKNTLSCCNGVVGELDERGYVKFDEECSGGHHGIWLSKPFENYYDLVEDKWK